MSFHHIPCHPSTHVARIHQPTTLSHHILTSTLSLSLSFFRICWVRSIQDCERNTTLVARPSDVPPTRPSKVTDIKLSNDNNTQSTSTKKTIISDDTLHFIETKLITAKSTDRESKIKNKIENNIKMTLLVRGGKFQGCVTV